MLIVARFIRNAFSKDPDRRLGAVNMVANKLLPDYRLTWSQIDWWHDAEFNAYLDRFNERAGINFNTHRRFMLAQLLKLVAEVEGDTAECGVYLGASSWLICGVGRKHHLFDSFEGLSEPDSADGTHWKRGVLSAPEDAVLNNLAPFREQLEFHRGWIPDRFADVADRKFAFVHVDVDLYQPTRDSVEFFYSRLSPGGILLCDDYACTTCPGATKAIDEFLADKPEPMIALDAGGGFFIKR
ncbi:MAG: TylF/MycF/NovP-related O-methyltransferase [Sphingomicrobium sp.]